MPRPPAGSLGSRQQSVLDALAAADDQPMTVRQLAEAVGRATPSGERGLRDAVDELEEKGLVAVERRAVLAVESKGIRQWRPAEPGETPEHRAGDPVPGLPVAVFAVDVVGPRARRPITGSLVSLTAAGRRLAR